MNNIVQYVKDASIHGYKQIGNAVSSAANWCGATFTPLASKVKELAIGLFSKISIPKNSALPITIVLISTCVILASLSLDELGNNSAAKLLLTAIVVGGLVFAGALFHGAVIV